ncbi:MAG TPA: hypothetical protein VMU70_02225 [Candidatus Tyrphobacter sp.]|nr:hypothetical protein [Candidatus Tyrphobacter sp.]
MNKRFYFCFSATIFLFVSLAHLLRIVYDWSLQIGGLTIPMWVSWIAFVVAGYLSWSGYRLLAKSSRG